MRKRKLLTLMAAMEILVANSVLSAVQAREIVTKRMQDEFSAEDVVNDLMEVDIPEEKFDIFIAVIDQIRKAL